MKKLMTIVVLMIAALSILPVQKAEANPIPGTNLGNQCCVPAVGNWCWIPAAPLGTACYCAAGPQYMGYTC
jgi:hypothetical protein